MPVLNVTRKCAHSNPAHQECKHENHQPDDRMRSFFFFFFFFPSRVKAKTNFACLTSGRRRQRKMRSIPDPNESEGKTGKYTSNSEGSDEGGDHEKHIGSKRSGSTQTQCQHQKSGNTDGSNHHVGKHDVHTVHFALLQKRKNRNDASPRIHARTKGTLPQSDLSKKKVFFFFAVSSNVFFF